MGRIILLLVMILFIGSVTAQVINRAEYFFNTDPGIGNGISTPITPGGTINLNLNTGVNALPIGFHTINFRVRDNNGVWSHTMSRSFYVFNNILIPSATQIVTGEYFINTDPGIGNGIRIPVTASGEVYPTILYNVSSLPPGFHTIGFRFRDNQNRWSHYMSRTFYRFGGDVSANSATLVKAEYFFDTDPGTGLAKALPLSAAAIQNNTFNIDITGEALSEGFHRLIIRYQDNRGQWSHALQRSFYIIPASVLNASNVSRLEYFIDTNPAITPDAPGTALPITPAATIEGNFLINLSGIPSGNHVLHVRAKDDKGFYSNVVSAPFTITACVPPAPPLVAEQTRCSPGTVTFSPTGAQGTQVYRWYDDLLGGNLLATAATYTTPTLSADQAYYVSVYDPSTLCESDRQTAQARIVILPKPVINPSGEIMFCEGNSIFLGASQGASQYTWSNGQNTQQILVNTAGEYTVRTGNGTCLSEPSDPVSVKVIPRPDKPVITAIGDLVICGTGSVTLQGPTGFAYSWSNGMTTRDITVTQTEVFFLYVRDASNCLSAPSDPVIVTFLTPPCGNNTVNNPPVIAPTPLASQIEGRVFVDLTTVVSDPDNNIDFTSLSVPDGVTARGVPAFVDESFNLVINYSGTPFSGTDRITIQVCDLLGACTQQVLDIEVVGDIIVYNGMSPDGDGVNDFLLIKYIDAIEGADQNEVKIFNRWGDIVFEITNYNNADRVFRGVHKQGNELPAGTYFYSIQLATRNKPVTGFLTLLR